MSGAGFGFAFGNFLQIVGNLLEINFNMWNVMEYSIGFFGGSALAYSVFTSPWPKNIENPKPWENRVSYIIVLIIVPIIVFQQSMSIQVLFERLGNSGISEKTALLSSIITGLLISLVIIIYVVIFEKEKFSFTKSIVFFIYLTFISVYVAISFIVSGIFAGNIPFNHVLYVVNIGVVLVLLRRIQTPFSSELNSGIKHKYLQTLAMIIIVVVMLAIVLVNIHGELGGSQTRFGLK
jgi:hypothetical protein